MTIGQWRTEATQKLSHAGIASAELDALLLLEFVLDSPRAILLTNSDTQLPATTIVKLDSALKLRLEHVPIAYILHKKEFYGREFVVNQHVLIPRPETETIIDLARPLSKDSPWTVLDMGTGSGCIGVTIDLELPSAKVTASDVSDKALQVAKLNAKHLGAQVTFKKSDLFANLKNRQFDIVCANLPYVPTALASKNLHAEPNLALFAGTDGLELYRRFFSELADLPHKPTHIITESLQNQHAALAGLAHTAGYTLQQTNLLAQLFVRVKGKGFRV